ncbi:putative mediator of RNA polymerase II transcription subunit 26 isoform X2 [Diaphorina citri]|uniref:Mediator of RNA polymerase II transcription subunit 26 isoform X2 n=1 Tax=Diaphorina citri TaxID=121845 RepID=A0A3Q0JL70_DIACI|nr:putative mediator of RNA polymerase II transcription subunit 26 isoform X2 [Diaphorina citri]XP_026687865.1 putative mediator of RNA polymerase II transcription subunit 26 isoform X2 [Diaphorina citri]XP_026687873.1 putative mediator of RNA polymerase II transcription subunit 26 isoform X2 [Diaphorina citri]
MFYTPAHIQEKTTRRNLFDQRIKRPIDKKNVATNTTPEKNNHLELNEYQQIHEEKEREEDQTVKRPNNKKDEATNTTPEKENHLDEHQQALEEKENLIENLKTSLETVEIAWKLDKTELENMKKKVSPLKTKSTKQPDKLYIIGDDLAERIAKHYNTQRHQNNIGNVKTEVIGGKGYKIKETQECCEKIQASYSDEAIVTIGAQDLFKTPWEDFRKHYEVIINKVKVCKKIVLILILDRQDKKHINKHIAKLNTKIKNLFKNNKNITFLNTKSFLYPTHYNTDGITLKENTTSYLVSKIQNAMNNRINAQQEHVYNSNHRQYRHRYNRYNNHYNNYRNYHTFNEQRRRTYNKYTTPRYTYKSNHLQNRGFNNNTNQIWNNPISRTNQNQNKAISSQIANKTPTYTQKINTQPKCSYTPLILQQSHQISSQDNIHSQRTQTAIQPTQYTQSNQAPYQQTNQISHQIAQVITSHAQNNQTQHATYQQNNQTPHQITPVITSFAQNNQVPLVTHQNNNQALHVPHQQTSQTSPQVVPVITSLAQNNQTQHATYQQNNQTPHQITPVITSFAQNNQVPLVTHQNNNQALHVPHQQTSQTSPQVVPVITSLAQNNQTQHATYQQNNQTSHQITPVITSFVQNNQEPHVTYHQNNQTYAQIASLSPINSDTPYIRNQISQITPYLPTPSSQQPTLSITPSLTGQYRPTHSPMFSTQIPAYTNYCNRNTNSYSYSNFYTPLTNLTHQMTLH